MWKTRSNCRKTRRKPQHGLDMRGIHARFLSVCSAFLLEQALLQNELVFWVAKEASGSFSFFFCFRFRAASSSSANRRWTHGAKSCRRLTLSCRRAVDSVLGGFGASFEENERRHPRTRRNPHTPKSLFDTLVRHRGTLLLETLVGHSCGTLLGHSYTFVTLLLGSLVGHSCGRPLEDAACRKRLLPKVTSSLQEPQT